MDTYRDQEILYFYYDSVKENTIIMDCHHKYYTEKGKCWSFLNKLCFKYGSDLEGRKNYVMKKLKIRQKVPILISDRNRVIFFPFYSYKSDDNIWIHYQMVKKVKNLEEIQSEILFQNDFRLVVNIHYRTIHRQMRRCKTIIKLLEEI